MLYRDDDVVCGDAVPTLHLHLQLAMLPPEPECIGQLTAQEEHSAQLLNLLGHGIFK